MKRLACIASLVLLRSATACAQVDPAVLQAEATRVAVVERASQAAVMIFAGQGGGSGVVISSDGYALSNFHVTHEAGTGMKCGSFRALTPPPVTRSSNCLLGRL